MGTERRMESFALTFSRVLGTLLPGMSKRNGERALYMYLADFFISGEKEEILNLI